MARVRPIAGSGRPNSPTRPPTIHAGYVDARTVLLWVPSFERVVSTTSPGFSHIGGFIPEATPWGVPVVTMSPASRTKNWLRYQSRCGTLNSMSPVLLFCRT
jgi:hypothetical protein